MKKIEQIILLQKKFYATGKTKDLAFRLQQLEKLSSAIKSYEAEILYALKQDLNKSEFEAYETEIGMVLEELKYIKRHLPKWMKIRKKHTPIMHFPSSSYLYPEPYGTVLIMSPWNYPFQLSISPLIGSIAAGNCSIIKPSAYASHTAAILAKLLSATFDASYVYTICGGRDVNHSLLEHHFDYIFFTGSVSVGKFVMESAAKYLTPITLELGGKSPCIVDQTANLALAAKRIVWGKFLNAGQTCVAPDYIYVHQSVKESLISYIQKSIHEFYGDNPIENPEYPCIINLKHYNRIKKLINSGTILSGGQYQDRTLQIAPTILDDITWDKDIMKEEIFGPLLPIMSYEHLQTVLQEINAHPKPLALYFFTTSKANRKMVLETASFGGGCINDTIIHLSNPNLPFSGVGESGMGQYHGLYNFLTFTHQKSIMKKSNLIDIPLRYPPFKNHLKLLKIIMH